MTEIYEQIAKFHAQAQRFETSLGTSTRSSSCGSAWGRNFYTENLRAKRSPKKEDDFGCFKWMKISGLRNGGSFSGVYLLNWTWLWKFTILIDALHMRDFHAFPASHVSLLEIHAKGDCVIWCGWISLWWNIHFYSKMLWVGWGWSRIFGIGDWWNIFPYKA